MAENDEQGLQLVFEHVVKHVTDPVVRLEAVKRLVNQQLLVTVALQDPDPDCALVAVERIMNEALLLLIIVQGRDPTVQMKALARITDSHALGAVIKQSKDLALRLKVMERIEDEDILTELINGSDDEAFALAALDKIVGKANLLDIMLRNRFENVRVAAFGKIPGDPVPPSPPLPPSQPPLPPPPPLPEIDINSYTVEDIPRITDLELLHRIVKEHENPEVRLAAVLRVHDAEILAICAINDRILKVAREAAMKLRSLPLLTKVAKCSRHDAVAQIAFDQLTDRKNAPDESLLIDIAEHAKSPYIRFRVLSKITNQHVLAKVVLNDSDPDGFIQKEGVNRIGNPEILMTIVEKSKIRDVVTFARRKIVVQMSRANIPVSELTVYKNILMGTVDLAVCKDVAVAARMSTLYLMAVEKLKGQDALVYVAENAYEPRARIAAVQRITDQITLVDIAKDDPDVNVCRVALGKISDATFLEIVAKGAKKPEIQREAQEKLHDPEVKPRDLW